LCGGGNFQQSGRTPTLRFDEIIPAG
jgi:hypothetical protein